MGVRCWARYLHRYLNLSGAAKPHHLTREETASLNNQTPSAEDNTAGNKLNLTNLNTTENVIMTNQIIAKNIITNFQEVAGTFGAGNRLWFGDFFDLEFTEEFKGESEQDFFDAAQRALDRADKMIPDHIRFECIYVLDELNKFGGDEGDVQIACWDVRKGDKFLNAL